MTIGKKKLLRVMVHVEAVTNMDDYTLERRFETFIDPNRMRSESLEHREYIRFLNTKISILTAEAPEGVTHLPTLPIVEPASDGMKLQAIKGILQEIKGTAR